MRQKKVYIRKELYIEQKNKVKQMIAKEITAYENKKTEEIKRENQQQ